MRLVLLQFARREELNKNLRRTVKLLSSVKDMDLVALPENWASRRVLSHGEHRALVDELKRLAKAGGYAVVAGAYYI